MKLFSILPDNYFTLLTLKYKEIYIEALYILLKEYKNSIGKLTVDKCIQSIIIHFNNKLFNLGDEGEENNINDTDKSPRSQARRILNQLIEYHWIEKNDDIKNLQEYITIPYYTNRFMRTIESLMYPQEDNTNNYASNVMLNINKLGDKEDMPQYKIFLDNAYRDTENLNNMLHEMFDNMRRYFDNLLRQAETSMVLKEHFDEYSNSASRKTFHLQKTRQNLFRFRQEILDKVNALFYDEETITALANQIMVTENKESLDDCYNMVIAKLDSIKIFFEDIEELMDTITNTHIQYVRTTMDKIQYLAHKEEGIKDNIVKVIQHLNSHQPNELLKIIRRNINTNDLITITEKSLWKPSKRRIKRDEAPVTLKPIENQEEIKKKIIARNKERLKDNPIYSQKSITEFVEAHMGKKTSFKTSDIELKDDTDFVKLILAFDYSNKNSFQYRAEILKEKVKVSNYIVPEIEFYLKGSEEIDR